MDIVNKKSVHDSYDIQREGKFSHNPIILILDFLCKKDSKDCTVFIYFGTIMILIAIIVFFFHHSYWLFCFTIPRILAYFYVEYIYRWLRHRYFKKHNLPGPYGWGTLDDFECKYDKY